MNKGLTPAALWILTIAFALAPPLLARVNKITGEPKKITFGPWIFPVFKLLAKL